MTTKTKKPQDLILWYRENWEGDKSLDDAAIEWANAPTKIDDAGDVWSQAPGQGEGGAWLDDNRLWDFVEWLQANDYA